MQPLEHNRFKKKNKTDFHHVTYHDDEAEMYFGYCDKSRVMNVTVVL